jgi:hypothetical protein
MAVEGTYAEITQANFIAARQFEASHSQSEKS